MTGHTPAEDSTGVESEPAAPPMTTTPSAQIAHIGHLEASANFARINWGPSDNHPHDLGTDLWVQVRNAQGEDLGCLVGVQVRTGDSYFKNADCVDGESGWWHEGLDARHVQHWLHHRENHLLVLHDHHTKVSYWEHINRKTVVSTGVGFKVFVPKTQTVDETRRSDLISVAFAEPETRRAVDRESAASVSPNIEPHQRLRYALVLPRYIASRSLSDPGKPISSVQGVALVVQGRFRDLKRFAKEFDDVPDIEQLPGSADWVWQFAAAVWSWATTNDSERLRAVFESAPGANSKAASGVLLTCAQLRTGQCNEALAVLDSLVNDELEPVDRGWVLVQRARVSAEAGEVDKSRADAEAALETLEGLSDDVAYSLAAAARWQLFSLDPLEADAGATQGICDDESFRLSCFRDVATHPAASQE